MRIILASASPRRKVLLEQIGLRFEIISPETDEDDEPFKPPSELVLLNAEKKAAAASKMLDGTALIIAADTTVRYGGVNLSKPAGKDDAFRMLNEISGKKHSVYTGVCVHRIGLNPYKTSFVEQADVYMCDMSPAEIWAYIETGEPLDKAGAYGLQGIGAKYVKRVEGDYSTVIGLPLCALWNVIKDEV
jgi:septum formation protein